MKNKFLLVCWICLFPVALFAQNHSYWFQSNQVLGSEFTQREDLLRGKLDIKTDKVSKKYKEGFVDANEYYIDRFLNSGMVITSSPANDYLNKVVSKLLSGNEKLQSELRFYLVYTSEVNAFTFTNGMIFMNLGLFARLKNEAQLAYILSHEIAHYQKQHAFERYTFNHETNENLDEEEFLEVVLSKFSRDQEFEADKAGLDLFLASGYKLEEAVNVFDILKEAEYPIANIKIPKTVFEGRYLKIPRAFYNDSAISIVLPPEESDTTFSHPSCGKRQEIIKKEIAEKRELGSLFLVGESQFQLIKVASQFELSAIYILERNYINSLYNTEVLLSQYPNNEVLNANKMKALYFMQANFNFGSGSGIIRMPRKINGEIRKFHQLFKKLSNEEINMVCLRQAWDIHKAFPQNQEMTLFCKGITTFFEEKVSAEISYFAKEDAYQEELIQSYYLQDTIEKKQKRFTGNTTIRSKPKHKESFSKYSMGDYLNDKEFTSMFKEVAGGVKNKKENEVSEIEQYEEKDELAFERSKSRESNKKADKRKKSKSVQDETIELTSNKLLIIDVSTLKVDLRSKNPVQFRDIQSKQFDLVQTIKNSAAMNQIEVEVFNPAIIQNTDTAFFNDRTLLERWKNERLSNENLPEILPSDYLAIEKLCERYGTDQVAFIKTISILAPNKNKAQLFSGFMYTVFHPALFAFALYNVFSTRKHSEIQFTIYQIKSGKLVGRLGTEYEMSDRNDLMKAEFYHFFHSIKK